MGCAPTRIWCPGSLDRGVSHVSINLSLTPRMKHTRVPRTIRRDIRRLAIETSSIPSLHIFRSRIRNHIASRIENRKKPNGLNRNSNRLSKKRKIHVPCAIITWADWCGARFALATKFLTRITWYCNSICRTLFKTKRICFAKRCTNINQPYLIWAVVHCRHVPQQRTEDTRTNNPIDQGVNMYSPRRC